MYRASKAGNLEVARLSSDPQRGPPVLARRGDGAAVAREPLYTTTLASVICKPACIYPCLPQGSSGYITRQVGCAQVYLHGSSYLDSEPSTRPQTQNAYHV